MPNPSLADTLFASLAEPFTAEALFDRLPDTVFFIKDREGRYVCVNQTLVARCGRRDKSELIGRSPSQVLGEPLGRGYEQQDAQVLRTGRELLDELELHVYPSRDLGWCLTSKLPLRGRNGDMAGLAGISRDLKMPDLSTDEFAQVAGALRHAEAHLDQPPGLAELAGVARMSVYQLDRRMKRLFGLSTGQWLLKARIGRASEELLHTDLPVASIALDVGYADQSAFSRQFRRATGHTPSQFRRLGCQAAFDAARGESARNVPR